MAGDGALEKAYGPAFRQGTGMLRELAEAAESGWDRARAVPLDWPRLVAARKCQSRSCGTA